MRGAWLALALVACGTNEPATMPVAAAGGASSGSMSGQAGGAGGAERVRLSVVAPSSGPSGTVVELRGSGFTPGMEVRFGALAALDVVVTADDRARCRAPAGAGLVDVAAAGAVLHAAFAFEADAAMSSADAGLPPAATDAGPPAPPLTLEAEAFTASSGVVALGTVVGFVDDGDWLAYANVDFGGAGDDTLGITLSVPQASAGQRLELHLDDAAGTWVGTLTVASTGGWDRFVRQDVTLRGAAGVHALVVVARGSSDVANLDRLELQR